MSLYEFMWDIELCGGRQKSIFPSNMGSVPKMAHIPSHAAYLALHDESINDNHSFWDKQAKALLHWQTPYTSVLQGSFQEGGEAASWFVGGELNVSYNCVDRHAHTDPDKVALIWEADEPGNSRKITYSTLLQEVCRCAGMLKKLGITKGSTVAIYMPMVPEAVYTMLACARIGAVHSVILYVALILLLNIPPKCWFQCRRAARPYAGR